MTHEPFHRPPLQNPSLFIDAAVKSESSSPGVRFSAKDSFRMMVRLGTCSPRSTWLGLLEAGPASFARPSCERPRFSRHRFSAAPKISASRHAAFIVDLCLKLVDNGSARCYDQNITIG